MSVSKAKPSVSDLIPNYDDDVDDDDDDADGVLWRRARGMLSIHYPASRLLCSYLRSA